jgi:competence protein ComEC
MKIYDVAFYFAGFFLVGVFLNNAKLSFLAITFIVALITVLFLLVKFLVAVGGNKLYWISGLSLAIILGAFYAGVYDVYQVKKTNIVFDKKINFSGIIVENPERGERQKLTVKLQPPYSGKILINLPPYPEFKYGDFINFEGVIKKPDDAYANYLAKNGVFGVATDPKNELISANNGSAVKSVLFKFKAKIISNFQKVLPAENSAFLAGLTLGERAEFSKEFKDAMSKSGTTHLVALSGYNISVIVLAISYMLAFLPRRMNFFITIIIILFFVLMAGAEASVVRAATMGFIALLAKQIGRLHSMRNAIVLAAFFMVILNPMVLSFDAGFQLSFLALLGLVYLSPAIREFFKIKEEPGFFDWRENLLTTTSVQLAVLPILIISFGNFSSLSLISNILILGAVPLTMTLGFILAGLGFVSYYLSLIFSWLVNLFLWYDISVIKIFGGFGAFRIENLSYFFAAVYYLFLIGFIFYINVKKSVRRI